LKRTEQTTFNLFTKENGLQKENGLVNSLKISSFSSLQISEPITVLLHLNCKEEQNNGTLSFST